MSERPSQTASWTDFNHPLWGWLLIASALANVLPLWAAKHLPFTDLPQHVAAIATLRHWFDPAWKAQQYFTLALSQTQYLLYYLAGALLAFPFGTAERANVVLLSIVGASFPFALRALLRSLRVDERLALFGAPLFWSQALLIGFFNYLAALPLLLWTLSLCVRQAEVPRRRTALTLAVASLALFYLHLSAFLFFAPAAVLAAWLLPTRSLLKLPARLSWMAPSALAGVLFLVKSPVVNPSSVGWTAPRAIGFEDVGAALRNLPAALLEMWNSGQDDWILLALIAAAALIAWPGEREAEDPKQRLRRGIAAAWIVWAWVLYFFFPKSIGWLWQLNERYAILAALLLPLLLRPLRGLRGAVPLLLVAVIAACSGALAESKIVDFDREVGGFDALLAKAQPGRRMIGLIYDSGSNVARFSPYLHYASLYRARSGGLTSFSFAELPQSPLRYRPESAPPAKPQSWEWHPDVYRNDIDGYYYDYVLIRGPGRIFDRPMPGPQWHLIDQSGLWQLWGK